MIHSHLADRDLILALDGEASAEAREHLDECFGCRERMSALKVSLEEFVQNRELESLPDGGFARSMLRARMSQEAEFSELTFPWKRLGLVAASVAFLITLVPIVFEKTASADARPRSAITPGEVRSITMAEVCQSQQAQVVVVDIPKETQNAVFAAYGMKPDSGRFEIDYLITPDLGGADSIRNMWPQPYSTTWNARVKDQLEQRLHQLVCSGQMELPAAQRELAADWIGAYHKYLGPR